MNSSVFSCNCFPLEVPIVCGFMGLGALFILLAYGAYQIHRRRSPAVRRGWYIAAVLLPNILFNIALALVWISGKGSFVNVLGRSALTGFSTLSVWLVCAGVYRHIMKKPEQAREKSLRCGLLGLALFTIFIFCVPFF